MIAAWMLYSTMVGILTVGAAILAEQFAHRNERATRRVWMLGLAVAALLPFVAVVIKDAPAAVEFDGELVLASPTAGLVMSGVERVATLDGTLTTAWMATSLLLGGLLAAGLVITWRRRLSWKPAEVDGVSVLLADNVGPAVVGFLRSQIVLPTWALDADETERAMMLRHEQEHLAVGDPRLILFAVVMVVLVPWNAALWYMTHRLRLAIEVDCDRRVMNGGEMDKRSYAELLLAVGLRRSAPAYGVGFSLGRPFLEQRIDRMTLPVGGRRSSNALLVLGVVGVMCAAWSLPQPVRAADLTHSNWGTCPNATTVTNQALLDAIDWGT